VLKYFWLKLIGSNKFVVAGCPGHEMSRRPRDSRAVRCIMRRIFYVLFCVLCANQFSIIRISAGWEVKTLWTKDVEHNDANTLP